MDGGDGVGVPHLDSCNGGYHYYVKFGLATPSVVVDVLVVV